MKNAILWKKINPETNTQVKMFKIFILKRILVRKNQQRIDKLKPKASDKKNKNVNQNQKS